jgi:peptidoglycan/xylan/chitin deacetylase (PgdA/CDA1 family)
MAKVFGFWAAVLSCICSMVVPVRAEEQPLDSPPAAACSLEQSGPPPSLSRRDAFPPGKVVLTFDDGPQPVATKKLLDLLEQHRLPATFFVVGLWIRDDTYQLIQRMVAGGHEIGTHTYNHDLYLTRRGWGVDYVEGQYELTHVLVELALLAGSPEEFRELHRRVLEQRPGVPLTPSQVRSNWRNIQRNHLQLLSERGFDEQQRVYPMLFARPPGGIPYEGHWPEERLRKEHEAALRRLGLINVLWHGGSGDTVQGKRDDPRFLIDNVRFHTKKGGVLLIHDRMRRDALVTSFQRMMKDPKIQVVALRDAVAEKYACASASLYASLRPSQALARRATKRAEIE